MCSPIARKIREAWLAFQLERRYSKDQLLALYLNQTYFGNFAFGLEAAGQNFFGKPAAQLSKGECALLVGLIQYPTGYNPLLDPDAAKGTTVDRPALDAGVGLSDRRRGQAGGRGTPGLSLQSLRDPGPPLCGLCAGSPGPPPGAGPAAGWRVDGHDDVGPEHLQEEAEASVLPAGPAQLSHPRSLQGQPWTLTGGWTMRRRWCWTAQTGEILAMVGSPDYFNERIQGNVNAGVSLAPAGQRHQAPHLCRRTGSRAGAASGWPNALTPASIIADLPTTF